MITKYEEFVNEGSMYNWMNKPYDADYLKGGFILAAPTILFWLFRWLNTKHPTWDLIILILCFILYLPLVECITREMLKGIYHFMRARFLNGQVNSDYKKAQALVEKYPDIEEPLKVIKMSMIAAVKTRNNKNISRVFHEMYQLKKELNQREKLDNFFTLSDEEKLAIRGRNRILNEIDPLREENWEEN